ncbi:glycosylphosphatidylinositol anchor attachment 1 protein [Anopheles ziemanni]|uniref:glycosylphosphatidylinositol anchor attachment 1 protein n=1 Tax=Anopheles coustani TaxID=139045 RepID=UPI002658AD8F|nr:glycosylphosphatidylinositol anchor attachment 1 protein [Anopheles coustani]XP_058172785.1 glycosylphosphatidylinositol anchor attachment 1 protein [Anopheles ziemanni]
MGLLTNPSISQKAKYCRKLVRYNTAICLTLYLLGVAFFCVLPDPNFSSATYFSENALLPGLVNSELEMDTVSLVKSLTVELQRERENYPKGIPYPWLLAKMRRFGLETHTHNFTLNYPFGGGKRFKGENVFGILRAPRIASTESIVISVPYRPPETVHTDVSAGVPLMLAFADFARKKKYWAKDIIFLVTEQEQLGVQAWLEAYHGGEEGRILDSGMLRARAGSIQAAINLEVQSLDISHINLKIEGLNGQLPNLDLHNLVQKLSSKNGITAGYKQTSASPKRSFRYQDKLFNLLSMVFSQASGVPTGNHGLFHKYGIEALTLEAVKRDKVQQQQFQEVGSMLRIIEGITRSLNNLLERFHQSFFFYLLVSNDRFVSIGDYMPSLALMAGSLLIKAFIHYLSIYYSGDDGDESEEPKQKTVATDVGYFSVGVVLLVAHSIGALAVFLPHSKAVSQYLYDVNLSTQFGLFSLLVAITAIAITLPAFCSLSGVNSEALHVAVLLEVGTVLLAVGMLNFSLGFSLSVCLVPFIILIRPTLSGTSKFLSRLCCLLINPMAVLYFVVVALTWHLFPELDFKPLLNKALTATMDALTFSVVDSMIYGNWVFDMVSLIFVPSWILLWVLLFPKTEPRDVKLKTN